MDSLTDEKLRQKIKMSTVSKKKDYDEHIEQKSYKDEHCEQKIGSKK